MSYLLLMTFLTNGIHALQHRWKKYSDYKGDYVENSSCNLVKFHVSNLVSLSAKVTALTYRINRNNNTGSAAPASIQLADKK